MKQGDKVWVFQVSPQEIVEGVCVDAIRSGRRTYVTIGYTTPSGAIIRSIPSIKNSEKNITQKHRQRSNKKNII